MEIFVVPPMGAPMATNATPKYWEELSSGCEGAATKLQRLDVECLEARIVFYRPERNSSTHLPMLKVKFSYKNGAPMNFTTRIPDTEFAPKQWPSGADVARFLYDKIKKMVPA